MNDFKPLRRRIGIATLLMALALLGLWCRSRIFVDELYDMGGHYHLSTGNGQLRYWQVEPISGPSETASRLTWNMYLFKNEEWYDEPSGWDISTAYQFPGFVLMTGTSAGSQALSFVCVSLLSLIIPLTLLSAWLLLSKPRLQKPVGEPTV